MELVAPTVPLESEEFTRRFDVRSEDQRFAVAFLEPRVMEALLTARRPPTLAVSEDRMLLVTRRLRPAAVIGLLHEAAALARRAPRVLTSLYPPGPAFHPRFHPPS
jgi:hypothetical protein